MADTTLTANGPTKENIHLFGNGPIRLIALHGWIADHHLLSPLLTQLDPSRFQVAIFDCRGYGERIAETGPMTTEAIADDLCSVADYLGWERFHVIGHSMGSLAAQYLAIKHAEKIESLFLLAPVPATGANIAVERRTALEQAIEDPDQRRVLISGNTMHSLSTDMLNTILELSISSSSASAMVDYMKSWGGKGFAERLSPKQIPCHVVMGQLDPGAHPDRFNETYQNWFPQAELTLLPKAGHYMMLEDPAGVLNVMEKHFAAFS